MNRSCRVCVVLALLAVTRPGALLAAQPITLPITLPVALPVALPVTGPDPLAELIGQTAPLADVNTALAAAVQSHPRVLEALAAQQGARQSTAEVRAGFLPTLDAGLSLDQSIARQFATGTSTRLEQFRPRQRIDASISGQQLITDFGATSARVDSARARDTAAQASAQLVASDVALNGAAAWDQLVLAQAQVALGTRHVARLEEILRDTQTRFEQGVGPRADVARVSAYVATAQGQLARLQRDRAGARARWREAFSAAAPDTLARLPDRRSQASTLDEALQLASRNNAGPARAQSLTDSAAADYNAARADRLPRLALQLNATRFNAFDSAADFDVRGQIVSRYPLFSGGARTARTAQALARVRSAEQSQAQELAELTRDTSIAFDDVTTLETERDTFRKAWEANIAARVFFIEQFKVARGTLLDLLQAEQNTFDASLNYARAITELGFARHVLLARTGELLPSIGVTLSFADIRNLWGQK